MSLETAFSAGTPIAASKMPITPATLRSDAATRAAPDDMVACNTVGEFVRSTIGAGLREPSWSEGEPPRWPKGWSWGELALRGRQNPPQTRGIFWRQAPAVSITSCPHGL